MCYPSFWGRAELKTRPLLPQEIMRFALAHPLQLPASASGQYVPVLPSFPLCWTRESNCRLSVSLLPWVLLVEMHPFPGAAGIAGVFPQVPSRVSRVGLYRTPALKCQRRRHLRAAAHPFQANIPILALALTKAPLVATARHPPKGSLSTTSSPTAGWTLRQLTAGNAWAAFCSQAHRQIPQGRLPPRSPALLSPLPRPEEEGSQPTPLVSWDNSEYTKTDFESPGAPLLPYFKFSARLMSLMLVRRSHPLLKQVRSAQKVLFLPSHIWQRSPTSLFALLPWFAYLAINLNLQYFTYTKQSLRNASTLR